MTQVAGRERKERREGGKETGGKEKEGKKGRRKGNGGKWE